jgi:D-alanyl-D-alanine carboxypeptidase (penicillin-binding protein 5/6)
MSKSSLLARGLTLYAALAAVAAAVLAPAARAAAPIPQPPPVTARAYILGDYHSGRVLAADHAYDRMEPASLTKLMTSYVVFRALREGRLKLTDSVTISEHAWRSEGSRTFVQVGTQIPAEVLIKGMIVQSGNDATIALAERVGGTEDGFAQIMNEYAKQLGLTGSHFANSDGLPNPEHYSTARDMFVIAQALIRDFPEYYPWYSLQEYTWNNITQHNRNGLLTRDPTVDGLKTGHTDTAGYCLVTSANHNGMRLISVVLGSPSIKAREDASAALLGYGYTFYETARARGRGEPVVSPRVYFSASSTAPLGVARDIFVTVPRGDAAGLRASTHVNEPLRAPLVPGQPVGELTLTTANGDLVARAPLVPLKPVPVAGLWTRMSDHVALWFR